MKCPTLAALLAVALCAPGCAGYRIRLADEAQLDGNLERTLKLVRSVARRGDAQAQHRLGLIYREGQGVAADDIEAARWLRKAAAKELEASRILLGQMYLLGEGRPEDDPEAVMRLLQAGENGSTDTLYRIAVHYMNGEIVPQSDDEALHWFRQAADAWDQPDDIDTRLVEDGLVVRVAELGLAQAQFRVGDMYSDGIGRPKSTAEAAKWFYLAATQDYPDAVVRMGWLYGQGTGVPTDYREALRWFREGAELNHPEAQYQLGLMFMRGVGVKLNEVQAHKWFNLAAANGHPRARQKRDTIAKRLGPRKLTTAEKLAIEWMQKEEGVRP